MLMGNGPVPGFDARTFVQRLIEDVPRNKWREEVTKLHWLDAQKVENAAASVSCFAAELSGYCEAYAENPFDPDDEIDHTGHLAAWRKARDVWARVRHALGYSSPVSQLKKRYPQW